eukprot:TRINITY_DN36_c1_g1_i1.p1 TRINITY_DN36_c1_g1~~TRINITY_DN36_c1_g1_i1.p1  ORF type:complete len:426 (+),score=113.46 TRINITY_DN36_c1_g1_i1:53-1330(+)
MALVEVSARDSEIIGDLDKEVDLNMKEITRELQTLDRELNDAHKEKGLLDTALMLSELQIIKLKDYNRLNAAKPDPEVAAKLQDLRNQLRELKEKKHKQADAAKKTVVAQYEKKVHRLEELKTMLEETKAKTNWAAISKGHQGNRDHLGQENKLRELKATLTKLEDEQQIQKQLTTRKTELIEQLSKRIMVLRDVQVTLDDLKTSIKDKESVKVDLLDELRTLDRIYHKKECLIKDLKTETDIKDPARIKRLESDKKVLQYEITKHSEGRRSNDKTIQAQHHRIKSLEAKLHAISVALQSSRRKDQTDEEILKYRPNIKDVSQDVIDAHSYNIAQSELERARSTIEAKDVALMQKDCQIEGLERKTQVLVSARDILMRKLKLETNEKERIKREYLSAIDREEEDHETQKFRLRKELQDYETMRKR